MDSLVTQALVGLVFVLSIALWSKSSSTSPSGTSGSAASLQKAKKKKRKNSAAVSSADAVPAEVASKTTADEPVKSSSSLNTSAAPVSEKIESPVSQPSKAQAKNGGNEKMTGNTKKKMTLEDFVAKTNEERVEDLERAARGDAGERDVGGDMIDRDLQPEVPYKKVARIEPVTASKSSPTPRSNEGGWENVGGKAKILAPTVPSTKSSIVASSNSWASSNPFALLPGSGAEPPRLNGSASAKPTTTSTPTSGGGAAAQAQAQTKRQRQNAAKNQAKKAEKDAIESDRLARLAQHKKQVEAERIKEFYKKQPNATITPSSVHLNGAKSLSNSSRSMPKASVNEKGSLVWD